MPNSRLTEIWKLRKYSLEERRRMMPIESFDEVNQALWRGDRSALEIKTGEQLLKEADEREAKQNQVSLLMKL